MNNKAAFQLLAIAHNGLLFTSSERERGRYDALSRLAAEIAAASCDVDAAAITALWSASSEGYATPRVAVWGAVYRQDKLLLVPSQSEGQWVLPGGWAEPNLSPGENVSSHLSRLLGSPVQVEGVLAVWEDLALADAVLSHPTYHVVFQCSIIEHRDLRVGTARFFTRCEVVRLPLAQRNRSRLLGLFRAEKRVHYTADFD